jgi:UDP-N-acetylmuramoyl-tripeptide--D-alanyl-D-alanine ligase
MGVEGRSSRRRSKSSIPTQEVPAAASSKGYVIIDDTYNANPSSMTWAISTLAALPARGKESPSWGNEGIGEESSRYHRELGAYLSKAGLGLSSFSVKRRRTPWRNSAERRRRISTAGKTYRLRGVAAGPGDTILVKGSRAFKMEDIVEALK